MTALLSVRGLTKRYKRPGVAGLLSRAGEAAVDHVSLAVYPGERVGLIGESGSGKTTLVRAALGLIPHEEGEVELLGRPLGTYSRTELRRLRSRCQLLLQNPDASLNPGLSVGALLRESARIHRPGASTDEVVAEVAARVGLGHRIEGLPFELSGGEKRRVGIARLLIADPDLIVADEPTAGLDASLKAEITDLLLASRGPTRGHLFISHDLPLICYACQRVAVMYAGVVVEEVLVNELGRVRHHPYTAALLAAAGLATAIAATHPAPPAGRAGPGCPYAGPCPLTAERCLREPPALEAMGAVDGVGTHRVACWAVGPGGTP
ncbi:MAG: ABC transporter ATP-binding protein [Pseudomonadota bacterium]